jgi:transcriptional regulator with XRE-family HTH domain
MEGMTMTNRFIVNYAVLGEKIRQKRLSIGLSQEAVSEKVGLSESFYGHIERGSKIMSIQSLVKIAGKLDLSLDYLLMDSVRSGSDEKLHSELDNIFRDKSPSQREYLLNILGALSDSIKKLQP